ncbi:MAG: hypothetical protein E7Z62_05475 [Thermoplasmata archaeon]|nr:hypothetical protein [Thermoplasmata archaeon]
MDSDLSVIGTHLDVDHHPVGAVVLAPCAAILLQEFRSDVAADLPVEVRSAGIAAEGLENLDGVLVGDGLGIDVVTTGLLEDVVTTLQFLHELLRMESLHVGVYRIVRIVDDLDLILEDGVVGYREEIVLVIVMAAVLICLQVLQHALDGRVGIVPEETVCAVADEIGELLHAVLQGAVVVVFVIVEKEGVGEGIRCDYIPIAEAVVEFIGECGRLAYAPGVFGAEMMLRTLDRTTEVFLIIVVSHCVSSFQG